jgi:LEA14-like dessication related protein
LILGPRRLALIAAIAAVALAIIFYPLIVSTPIDLEKVNIALSRVVLSSGGEGDQELNLRVTFGVNNTNDFTLTTSKIEYELFADGTSIGTDILSYEDVPPNGRPPFFSGTSVPLSDTFTLRYSDANAEIFNRILEDTTQIQWRASGTSIIESVTTFVTKEFSDEL